MSETTVSAVPRPMSRSLAWVLLGAVLLPCLYLPTLATNFDFIDDGNLVYPAPPMPLAERLDLVWLKIVNNFKHLGPFRPVLWLHWEAQAELLGGSPVCWRIWRLAWTMFAAGALLALLRDLRFRPGPSLVVTALAMWNPFRGEVWTSLTLAEGLAMPYALLAFLCAVRANRSSRPWIWDLAGMLAVLAALGCKNTFAALVPAQVLLRLAPDGQSLREGWRQHGRRALLLLLPLLLPVIHFIIFTLSWRPGQYTMNLTCLGQARRMVAADRRSDQHRHARGRPAAGGVGRGRQRWVGCRLETSSRTLSGRVGSAGLRHRHLPSPGRYCRALHHACRVGT